MSGLAIEDLDPTKGVNLLFMVVCAQAKLRAGLRSLVLEGVRILGLRNKDAVCCSERLRV